MQEVVPVVHVPDVCKAVEWYMAIGFELRATNTRDGVMDWAALCFGNGEIMLTEGGRPSLEDRREVDLYIRSNDVEGLFLRLKDRVDVREALHETFYGTREFIIRDLNGFWLTFRQDDVAHSPSSSADAALARPRGGKEVSQK